MSDITCGSPAVQPPSHAPAARDVLLEVLCFFQGLTCSQRWIGSNNQFDPVPRQSATNVSITVAVIRSTPHPTFPKSLHRLSNILKHLWGVIWEVQRERHANIFLLPKENILRRGGKKKIIVASGEEKYTSTSWQFQGNSGSRPNTGNGVEKAALCGGTG